MRIFYGCKITHNFLRARADIHDKCVKIDTPIE